MIDKHSETWRDVQAHITKRIEKLREELWSENFTHTLEKDHARRVGIAELLMIEALTKPKPENPNE